jgi:hypothetical protein
MRDKNMHFEGGERNVQKAVSLIIVPIDNIEKFKIAKC